MLRTRTLSRASSSSSSHYRLLLRQHQDTHLGTRPEHQDGQDLGEHEDLFSVSLRLSARSQSSASGQSRPESVTYNVNRNPREGSVTDVFKGEHRNSLAAVAIKHLRVFHMLPALQRPLLIETLRSKASAWLELDHPRVLPFCGIVDNAELGGLCVVTPWCENGTILQDLERQVLAGLSGSALVKALHQLLYGISSGLEYLHKHGVIHGGLRGSNIFVDMDHQPQIADYGVEEVSNHAGNYSMKTVAWLAPELLDPEGDQQTLVATRDSDVYAFGCVCVELYTRQNPFPGQKEIQIATKVMKGERPERPMRPGEEMSEGLWGLVRKTWAPNPKNRLSAFSITEHLRTILNNF